jgi:hypothetical protein
MTIKIQLDLFKEENELSILRKQLQEVASLQDKLKKTLYARHQDLARLCLTLKEENDLLRSRLERIEKAISLPKETTSEDLKALFQEAYL